MQTERCVKTTCLFQHRCNSNSLQRRRKILRQRSRSTASIVGRGGWGSSRGERRRHFFGPFGVDAACHVFPFTWPGGRQPERPHCCYDQSRVRSHRRRRICCEVNAISIQPSQATESFAAYFRETSCGRPPPSKPGERGRR